MNKGVILDHNGRPMQRASVRQRGLPVSDGVPRSVSGQSALEIPLTFGKRRKCW
ncbi:MAG TPA: hypothetical protein VGO04_23255 [Ensifer sp.]|jgi:hypothetical protein|uniref:hypothetical protein n=1 Tax=Ensifer sp. TaxID=1872086 RepID=UPI002E0E0AFE|nr:hypothetical protein [Ensifer sp.]